jgi:hypothetical protein
VLYSRADETIPFQDSVDLIERSGLSGDHLIEVGHDHRLADENSLLVMLWACEVLGAGQPLPVTDESPSEQRSRKSDDFKNSNSNNDGSYICDSCGEEIVIPLDVTEGAHQTYVEDCPVCCRANAIHVEIDENGEANVWIEHT